MWAFGSFFLVMSVIDFISRWLQFLEPVSAWFDGKLQDLHKASSVVPYMIVALGVAVVAPVMEIYTSNEWVQQMDGQSAGGQREAFASLLTSGGEQAPIYDLIHMLQMAILFTTLWLGSIVWCDAIAKSKPGELETRFGRSAFYAGFAAFLGLFGWGVSYIGQHPDFVLQVAGT